MAQTKIAPETKDPKDPVETLVLRRRRTATKDISLAGIILYCPFEVVSESKHLAWTDGIKHYYGPRYFKLDEYEQIFVMVHESLHIALRHVQRAQALWERRGGEFSMLLWNVATDAVINNSLRQVAWCKAPDGVIMPEMILPRDVLQKRPAETWTSEEIYDYLIAHAECSPGSGGDGKGENNPVPGGYQQDLDPDGTGRKKEGANNPFDRNTENEIWRERIVRASAGSQPNGALRKLSSDIPKSEVQWEKVLRQFMVCRVMPTTEASWSRPSRRTLAWGDNAPFIEAGIERSKGVKRAGIVFDTSGSIDDQTLQTFLGEVNAIIAKTGCEVVLIDCDAAVHQISLHRTPIRNYVPKGGGGTDFRPAIEELEKHRVDVAIYLTDLCGSFPDRPPSFPIMWAATTDAKAPFGVTLALPRRP